MQKYHFSWERVDSGLVSGDDNAVFAGQGRPGVEVTARLNDGSRLLLNSTIVDENGNWRMEISQTMLGDGNHDIMFEYSGEDYSVATSLQSGQFEEGSLLWLWIVIGVVVVVVLSGLLVYFFVEIEIDDDDCVFSGFGTGPRQVVLMRMMMMMMSNGERSQAND